MAKQIEFNNVARVYNGRANACCCGCAGKYSYPGAKRELGSARRGYAVTDDEVNDKRVERIVNKINRALAENEDSVEFNNEYCPYASLETETKLYIAYFE